MLNFLTFRFTYFVAKGECVIPGDFCYKNLKKLIESIDLLHKLKMDIL